MNQAVTLSLLVEAMVNRKEETTTYLALDSGQIFSLSYEDFSDAETDEPLDAFPQPKRDLIARAQSVLSNEENYLSLPESFEVHENVIMEDYCAEIEKADIQAKLLGALRNKNGPEKFLSFISSFGLQEHWQAFRESELEQLAIDWCEANSVPYSGG